MSEKTKNILLIIAAVIIIALIISGIFIYRNYKNAQNDVVIWNDSTYYYKNKYDEEYFAKNTYIMKVDELQKYNDSLYKEYKSLKDHPIVITKTQLITQIDTIHTIIDSVFSSDEYTLWTWHANDSCWYSINGSSKIETSNNEVALETKIDKLEIDNGVTLDVIDNGEQLVVIAKSDNPYSKVNDLQSVVIDPTTSPTLKKYFKQKRWGFGPYFGIGVYSGWGYGGNPASNGLQVGVGASIGFSIHYDLIQW